MKPMGKTGTQHRATNQRKIAEFTARPASEEFDWDTAIFRLRALLDEMCEGSENSAPEHQR